MNRIKAGYSVLFICCLLASCKTAFLPAKAEYEEYRITDQLPQDSALLLLLKPYRDSINTSMNDVVGIAEKALEKKQPEGTLGNFVADAMYYSTQQIFNTPVDAAFVNYGGIRIIQLPKGAVTRGKIFEIMPFDNIIIIQQMKGSILQQFLDLIAAKGGWPSSGISMQIKNKKAVNVRIGGQPLDANKVYTIVNSDYIANGGDDMTMLKEIPQQSKNYLMRAAIFDYILFLKKEGKNISANEENRVSNAQ